MINSDVIGTTPPLPSGTWLHLAGVFRPSESVEVWVNGVEEACTAPTMQFETGDPLQIGQRPVQACCRFHGKVDNVRIYARALANEELVALSHECP